MQRCKVDEDERAHAEAEGRKDAMECAKDREAEDIAADILDGWEMVALEDMLRNKMNRELARHIWIAAQGKSDVDFWNVLETAVREYAWECVYGDNK